jgi:5,10-methylenetetrahydromethanopterin reductase
VSFDGRETVTASAEKADTVLANGCRSLWLACHLFERDPVVSASVMLARHPDLHVTLVALSPYVLHPVHIAMAAATMDEHFPGRVSLCLGVGAPGDLAAAGIEARGPLGTMREAISVCRTLLAGDTATFRGERFHVSGRALSNGARDIPILIAATGPRMLELAGGHADGVVFSAGASVPFIEQCMGIVARADPPPRFQHHAFVYSSVDARARTAYDRVRGALAITLRGQHHAKNLELTNNTLDRDAINAALAAGDRLAAARHVADSVVEHHAAAGTSARFRSRLAEYEALGLDNLVLSSMRTPEQIEAVLSAVRGRPDWSEH